MKLKLIAFFALLSLAVSSFAQEAAPAEAAPPPTALDTLQSEARALVPVAKSEVGRAFLMAVADLPVVEKRSVYYRRADRKAMTKAAGDALGAEATADFKLTEIGDRFYWYTGYGSPLAFLRPLEVAAAHGLESLEGARVVDFGFGSIGQLRLMASLGANVHGIEVDSMLQALYTEPGDTGRIHGSLPARAKEGHLTLHFGYFPGDAEMRDNLGGGFDVFFSKNTLKKGYIHPDREAKKEQLIDLGVSDEEFLAAVAGMLKEGGLFIVYNLHPRPSAEDEPFVPWSDGRFPFARELAEKAGFEVLAFDQDDREGAHELARALGWEKSMNLEEDLFATMTVLRKAPRGGEP